ncbi:MAG: putative bifunctional diguanylate cyclase/phosphodiesterase [Methylococcaceae bacterium]
MNHAEALSLVLIIDDDPTLHLWAERHLAGTGFALLSALDGPSGVEAFKIHVPAIVLVDIDMPEMDGFAVCAAIRELPSGRNTPILMVTGTEDAERIASSYAAGATDFVVKPINWKVLIHRLHYMVKASSVLNQLEKSEARLTKAQQMARLGHWEWNMLSNELDWSDEVFEIFEQARDSFVPDWPGFQEMIHAADRLFVEEGFDKAIKKRAAVTIDYRIITGKGRPGFVEQQIEIIENPQHELIGLTGTIQDITERKQHENQVRQLAYYDAVTGLPNRSCFLELLARALELAKRYNRSFAVLFLDMDGFKGINDCYGHSVGDLLLEAFAKRLTDGLRRSDVASRYLNHEGHDAEVARLGGDEFTILLNDLHRPEDAAIVASNIQKWVSEPFLLHNQQIHTAASIGIAIFPQDGEDCETLLKNADVAMYHAKKSGKGHYQFFHNSMNIKARKRQKMETLMHQAIANNELRLFYEPIVDAASSQLIGAEALIRWESPQLGFLYPDNFIPLAEENGMIIKLGEWAIRQVCSEYPLWRQQDMGHLTISVNVSGLQFNQSGFVAMVEKILTEYQVAPGFLVFELTENTIMSNSVKMMSSLLALKKLGVKLSIDDFGTGYSSLSYLKQFPLDFLKIDKSFVKDLPANSEDAAIVNAILAVANTLNLHTIAEGVETEQQRVFFENNTCQAIQGYLFAKPMLIDEFKKYWQIPFKPGGMKKL